MLLGGVVMVVGGYMVFSKNIQTDVLQLQHRVEAAEAQLKRTHILMASVPEEQVRITHPAGLSLTLLQELTLPLEADRVEVVSLSRSSPPKVTLTLEGEYADLMRYVGYLERDEGRFRISGGEFSRDKVGTRKSGSGETNAMIVPSRDSNRTIYAKLHIEFKG